MTLDKLCMIQPSLFTTLFQNMILSLFHVAIKVREYSHMTRISIFTSKAPRFPERPYQAPSSSISSFPREHLPPRNDLPRIPALS